MTFLNLTRVVRSSLTGTTVARSYLIWIMGGKLFNYVDKDCKILAHLDKVTRALMKTNVEKDRH